MSSPFHFGNFEHKRAEKTNGSHKEEEKRGIFSEVNVHKQIWEGQRVSGHTHNTELFPKVVVLITCEIHDINSGTWLQFLVLPQSFECVVTA